MRVIRTETYFDGNYIQRRVDKTLKTTDVCFAWINFERTGRLPTEQLPDLEGAREIHPDQVPLVLDYILRRERIQPFVDPHESILNGSAIEQVLNEPIVIEQSPLDTETLTNILKSGIKGSTVALSVYVAFSGDVYLFLKLPAAMLIIGASKGMSKWLEQNVPKLMSKATRRWFR